MSNLQDVHSVARVAATLRSVLKGFRRGEEQSVPLLVGEEEGGEPEAVLLPYDLYLRLCGALELADDLDAGDLAMTRLVDVPPPGEGLDTAALARLVAAAQPDHGGEFLEAGGASVHVD